MTPDEQINGIPTRLLGSTGERVTIIGVGGFHAAKAGSTEGVRIIRSAIDEGINFLDNAWCYLGGSAEEIMGQALRDGYRDRVFLMTKNHGRDAATFWQQLEQSLRRLGVERIDLLQFHEINDEGLPAMLHSQGVLEAALEAREQGKLRYIGFTGHRWPHLLQEMLALPFDWDTAQMPVNLLDAQYRSFGQQVIPLLRQRGMGAIAMKSLAFGRLMETSLTPEECMHYTLSQPIDVLVTGIDSMRVLEQNLRIARSFVPLSAEEQRRLLARVAPHSLDGHLEFYKNS